MADVTSYSHQKERLEEIVVQIRAKDIPLEKSLDLYDEALAIGTKCVEYLEQTDFTADELQIAAEQTEVALSGEVTQSEPVEGEASLAEDTEEENAEGEGAQGEDVPEVDMESSGSDE